MTKFRMVRIFNSNINPTTEKAYRVESVEPMSEREALQLLSDLGSPYQGARALPNWVDKEPAKDK